MDRLSDDAVGRSVRRALDTALSDVDPDLVDLNAVHTGVSRRRARRTVLTAGVGVAALVVAGSALWVQRGDDSVARVAGSGPTPSSDDRVPWLALPPSS